MWLIYSAWDVNEHSLPKNELSISFFSDFNDSDKFPDN